MKFMSSLLPLRVMDIAVVSKLADKGISLAQPEIAGA
jgi:hypothetical protein